ncbi:hypothetical protein NKI39_15550 [Mesorhizobium sp. M0664]|uniref:hypothetical protein n=1 Tax=Mesorhizobium sp. M0664 TaxID=2956982 RepID=UPI0033389652
MEIRDFVAKISAAQSPSSHAGPFEADPLVDGRCSAQAVAEASVSIAATDSTASNM